MHLSNASLPWTPLFASANALAKKTRLAFPQRKTAILLLAAAIFFPGAGSLLGQTTTIWSGASSTTWATSGNWSNGIPQSSTYIAEFNTTFSNSPTVGTNNYSIGELLFGSSLGQSFTIGATAGSGEFQLTDSSGIGINNDSTKTITINPIIQLNNSQTWEDTNSGGGSFTVAGAIALNSKTLTLDPANSVNSITLGGIISGTTAAALIMNGAGTVTLSGANTYTGTTVLSSGTLDINNAAALGTGALTIDAGTTINNNSAGTITDSNNNAQTWAGSFTFTGTQSLNLGTGAVTLTASPTVTVSANTLTEGGIVSGAFGLTKAGAGTLALTGINTYTGATTINAGTLQIAADSGLGAAPGSATTNDLVFGGGTLATTATFTLNSNRGITLNSGGGILDPSTGTTLTYGGIIAGTHGLTLTGGGTLLLNGANTFTGGVTLSSSSSTLDINSTSALGTGILTISSAATIDNTSGGALTLANNQTWNNSFTFTGSNNLTFSTGNVGLNASPTVTVNGGTLTEGGVVSGAFGLTKAGAGTLTLSGVNTYSGATTINAGTLSIAADSGLGAAPGSVTASDLVFGGGALATTSTFTLNSNRGVTLNSGGGTFTPSSSTTLTYGGIIAGTGALTKNGTGTLTLSGANTYTGATTVSAGTLSLQNTYASSSFSIASGATLQFNPGSSTINFAGTTFSGAGTLQETGTGVVEWGLSTTTFSLGSGSLIDVEGGTFTGGDSGQDVWTNNLSGLNVASGATFDGVESNVRVDALTGSGTIMSGWGGSSSLAFGVNNGSGTFSGVLADSPYAAGNYIKAGSGTQTLTGVNTYTGTTTISGGTLQIGGSGSLGSGSYAGNISNSGTLEYSSSAAQTLSGIISGTGGLTKDTSSSSTLTLSGVNTYTGATNITSGTVQTTNNAALGSLTGGAVNISGGGTLDIGGDATANDVNFGAKQFNISGTGVGGNGVLINSSSNAQTNAFQEVALTGNATIGGTGRFDIRNTSTGATLNLAGYTLTKTGTDTVLLVGTAVSATGNIIVNGGEFGLDTFGVATTANGSGTITYNTGTTAEFWELNSGNVTENMVFNGTNTILAEGGSSILNSNITLSTGDTTNVDQTAFGYIFTAAGNLSGAGNLSLNSTGDSGTLALSGTNTYTGTTTISAGTLQISGSGSLGSGSYAGNISNSGTLEYSSSANQTLSGIISGTGGLTKDTSSSSTLTLSGANTYTGATTINAGTLSLNNAAFGTTPGSYTIASGATLQLTGAVTEAHGTTTISGAGTFSLASGASLAGNFSSSGYNLTMEMSSGGSVNIASGATLTNGGWQDINWTSNQASMTVNGTLDLWDGNTVIVDALNGSGTVDRGNVGDTTTQTLEVGVANGSGTFSGVIQNSYGTVALTKVGTGAETLSGTNTYSGGTTLSGGTLNINSSTALGTGNLTINAGTKIDNTSGGAITLSNNNTQTWAGSFTYGGTKNLNLGTGAVTLTATPTITLNAGTLTEGGVISGNFGLTTAGTGTLVLSGANNFTGAINVTGGSTLQLGANQTFSSSTLDLNASTLNLNGFNLTLGTLEITGASVINFGNGSSILNLTNLTMDAGSTLTIDGWNNAVEYFYATNNPGTTALGQITFATFLSTNTKFNAYTDGPDSSHQITPVPEPSTYGAIFTAAALALFIWNRRKAYEMAERLKG